VSQVRGAVIETACPIYCLNLEAYSFISGNRCICDTALLDKTSKACGQAWRNLVPAIIGMVRAAPRRAVPRVPAHGCARPGQCLRWRAADARRAAAGWRRAGCERGPAAAAVQLVMYVGGSWVVTLLVAGYSRTAAEQDLYERMPHVGGGQGGGIGGEREGRGGGGRALLRDHEVAPCLPQLAALPPWAT
jgi:hypothetical protein